MSLSSALGSSHCFPAAQRAWGRGWMEIIQAAGGDTKQASLSWLWRRLALGNMMVAKQLTLSLAMAWFLFGPDILSEKMSPALPGASPLLAASQAGTRVRGLAWG